MSGMNPPGVAWRIERVEHDVEELQKGEDPRSKALTALVAELGREVRLLRWTIVGMALASGVYQVFFQGGGATVANAMGLH